MEEFTGENDRRKDSTSVRLALLERSYFENKDSLVAVHKRISEHAVKFEAGVAMIVKKIDDQQAAAIAAAEVKAKECKEHTLQTCTLVNKYDMCKDWLAGLSLVVGSICGWIAAHLTGHQEAANKAVDLVKKLKGGG